MKRNILLVCFLVYITLQSIFQSKITKNRMKPNIISRLFYKDDTSFIKSWAKTKEIGMFMWSIKGAIFSFLFWVPYFWLMTTPSFDILNDFKENKLIWLLFSTIFVLFSIATTEMRWNRWEDKYNTLKGEDPSDQLYKSK